MSVKFLPFVTDKSSPEAIFKALVQRSKGVSNKQLSAIFSAILDKGVEEVKEYAAGLPGHYSSNEVFESLSNHYIDYALSAKLINFLAFIYTFYGVEKLENFEKYSQKEYSVLFSCLFIYRTVELKALGFDCEIEADITNFTVFETAKPIEELEHTSFSVENGTKVGFCHPTEFLAFVAYIEYVYKKPAIVNPVNMGLSLEDVREEDYTEKYCLSPLEAITRG